jgi:hypothetical protein
MKIQDIITKLDSSTSMGYQLSRRNGILNSTWLLYKTKGFYFYLDINQKIEFIDRYKYTREELINEFQDSFFTIEDSIN